MSGIDLSNLENIVKDAEREFLEQKKDNPNAKPSPFLEANRKALQLLKSGIKK